LPDSREHPWPYAFSAIKSIFRRPILTVEDDVAILLRIEAMKLTTLLLTILLLGACAAAQDATTAPKSPSRAAIEGIVTKEPGSEPVKKAVIELIAEISSGQAGSNYTAVTGVDGAFRIENILPGRYHLFAERPGMLDAARRHGRTDGQILSLTSGQELKDVHIRLQAAAVVRGRVTDEDGDPLPNAEVTVLRQTYVSGHRHWEQAGAERTNDLGEYRVANLPARTVYVSVTPPPDFRSLIEGAGADPHNGNASDKPAPMSYQTMYYPGTLDRSQASAIELHPGDDFPVNFSLAPSPTLTVRGVVANLPPHATAGVMLQSHDFALIFNGAEIHKDGSFIIHDVAPGSYTIVANVEGAAAPMMARQSLQVGGNVDDVRLSPQPGASVRGRLRFEGKSPDHFDPDQIFLLLTLVDGDEETLAFSFSLGNVANVAHVAPDGSFEFKEIPPGDYYIVVGGNGEISAASEDWYVKSIAAGGRDLTDAPLNVNGGSVPLDVVVSSNGGVAEGVAADSKGNPVPDAVVVAVPEARLRSRIDRYRETVTDQSGRFTLRGLRPGDYTLLAWQSVEGDAYYNPDFVKSYESQGTPIHVNEGEHKSAQLQVIADPENQPE
jgi:hypothetical protein